MKTAGLAVGTMIVFLAVIGLPLPAWLVAFGFGAQLMYLIHDGEARRKEYRLTQKKIRQLKEEKLKNDWVEEYEKFRNSRAITTSFIEVDD